MPCSKCKTPGHNARTCTVPRVYTCETDDECPICMEKFNNNKLTTSCKHAFCVSCVENLYKMGNDKCPLCRKKNNHKYNERKFPPRTLTFTRHIYNDQGQLVGTINTTNLSAEEINELEANLRSYDVFIRGFSR
jgi:hypothetical protein